MNDYDSILGLYSEDNYLSQVLNEKFTNKYVDVRIFNNFSQVDYSKFSYLIINLLNKSSLKEEVLNILGKIPCKVVVLVPSKVISSEFQNINILLKRLLNANLNLGILLVPEILGKGVNYNNKYLSHNLIKQSLVSDRLVVSEININVISINKLVKEIITQTFSFGISGKKMLISGVRIKANRFVIKYLNINKDDVVVRNQKYEYKEIEPDVIKNIDCSLKKPVYQIKSEFKVEHEKTIKSKFTVSENKVSNGRYFLNKFKYIALLLIVLYILPVIFIGVSILSLYLSSNFITKNTALSKNMVNISAFLVKGANNLNYNNSFYISSVSLLNKINGIFLDGLVTVESGNRLISNMLGTETYNIQHYSDQISASLDKIYKDISFLQTEKYYTVISKNSGIDLSDLKNKLFYLKNLVSRSSELLGMTKPKKYLLIFQNNMELRPTGGFIGSFAIITFDKGRMIEMVVSDVYSADGQLNGHVEPPMPIKQYLKEGGWYLRDSNWDPDFPESAEKVKWFLDKEIDQKVDGVISIDLNFIRNLLRITGPINLSDYNQIINAENLYNVTQSEVEQEFFPGSIKKASFLTSLGRNLLNEVKNLPNEKYTSLFRELYRSLEEKHIQIYLNDSNAQDAVYGLGYSGNLDVASDCGMRCFIDSYALVDSNLGVNKSNLFINRDHEFNVKVTQNNINHELLITYKNNAGKSLDESGTYKNYARVFLPSEANVTGIRIYEVGGSYVNLPFDIISSDKMKSVGFYFEVFPSSANKIQVVWDIASNKLMGGGELRLNIRKQSGTDSDNLRINITTPDFTLTKKAYSSYNTTLLRDYKQKIFLK